MAEVGGSRQAWVQVSSFDDPDQMLVEANCSVQDFKLAVIKHFRLGQMPAELTVFLGERASGRIQQQGDALGPWGVLPLGNDSYFFVKAQVDLRGLRPQDLDHVAKNSVAVREYALIADALKDHPVAKSIVSAMQGVLANRSQIAEDGLPFPFFVIDASSGTGKTQAAFFLRAGKWKVVYLLISSSGDNPQRVYAAFNGESQAFRAAAKADSEAVPEHSVLSLESVPGPKCWCLAVLARLLGKDEVNEPLSAAEFKTLLGDQEVVVFLDECQDNDKLLRFARNILRAAAVLVVLMGTNTNAVKLLAKDNASRTAGGRIQWAHVVTRLPPTQERALRLVREGEAALDHLNRRGGRGAEFLKEAILQTRPLFARLLCQAIVAQEQREIEEDEPMEEGEDEPMEGEGEAMEGEGEAAEEARGSDAEVQWLKGVFEAAAVELSTKKRRSSPEYLRGQCALFQAQNRLGPNKSLFETNSTALVNQHFANLDFGADHPDHPDVVYMDLQGTAIVTGEPGTEWQPCSTFPRLDCDPALFLTLAGGPKPAFGSDMIGEGPLSPLSSAFVFRYLAHLDSSKSRVPSSNPNAIKWDGDHLEALASMGVIVASHQGGLGGTPMTAFLGRFGGEMLGARSPTASVNREAWMTFFDNLAIPFLGAVNEKWPESLLRTGCVVGSFTRPSDAEGIDGRVDDGEVLTVECKAHHQLAVDEFRKVLLRARECTSRVHLLVTTGLKRYKPKPMRAWLDPQDSKKPKLTDLLKWGIVLATIKDNTLELKPLMKGLCTPRADMTKLVVVFEVPTAP